MTTSAPVIPEALTAADAISATLTSPGIVFPPNCQDEGRRSPQSLAGGATGIALLHVERARSGHGDWATARAWLANAACGHISAASNHSGALAGAAELGLADVLAGEFSPPPPGLADALTYCDMTTGPDGEPRTVADRLADILSRYGPGDPVSRAITVAAPDLTAAVARVADRLAGSPIS